MARYAVTLTTEGHSAAEVAARVAMDADGEYITEWQTIEVMRIGD